MEASELEKRSPAELTDAITQIQAIGNALHRRQLAAIVAYDRKEAWKQDGATSMDAWLVGWLGYGREHARDTVRVAHAFEELPSIAGTYEQGLLSWDQARAVTEFATPETDAHLAEQARRFSARQLRRMARRFRPVDLDEIEQAHRTRELRYWWDLRAHALRLAGTLPEAEGAVVVKALERIASNRAIDPAAESPCNPAAACADALVELASMRLAADPDADRATVGVHVDVSVLLGRTGMAELDGGIPIAPDTARRLLCDSRWYVSVDRPDGVPLGIGRTNRQIPPWLAREIRHRDGGCRFPGCDRTRWTPIHHIKPWGQEGRTDYDNLVLLCGPHHRLVHEGGWTIEGDPNSELTFISPDGRVFKQGPPALRAELRRRVSALSELPPGDVVLEEHAMAGPAP